MKEYKFEDPIVANKITKEQVDKKNTTLCITNNYLKVSFEKDSWDGVANKIISSCRQK